MVIAPPVFADEDVLAGQFDRHPFIVGGGMKPATLGAAAIVDRPASEDFRELFKRRFVS